MHIYFSGIGGAGTGPLALVAKQAGYEVSGSDKQDSSYVTYLRSHGIEDIHIGQDEASIAAIHQKHPIDWFVYSSALPLENPNHPELLFCEQHSIRMSKRNELLNQILADKNLKLIAIAGTHGKTTTTAMAVWLLQQLGMTFSYLLPGKTSFADMGAYNEGSEYFVYEADEFDRNFLAYRPELSLITGIDWDHPDIYPTRENYNAAFHQFIEQSAQTWLWQEDAQQLGVTSSEAVRVIDFDDYSELKLPGEVNRRNAALVAQGLMVQLGEDKLTKLTDILNSFPGVSRRFEQIAPGLYSDYAHTPPKIRGALQLGHEAAGDNLVVVYEGLHNTRQHFIKNDLVRLFDDVKQLYVVPSYLAREDTSLELLTPDKLRALLSPMSQTKTTAAELDEKLVDAIRSHITAGDTVLCLSAGGGNSLDEWLRKNFTNNA
jgi:UDP-N-acetylmuramate--alanine ligase